jgi:outer membrane protein assembly factor BamB
MFSLSRSATIPVICLLIVSFVDSSAGSTEEKKPEQTVEPWKLFIDPQAEELLHSAADSIRAEKWNRSIWLLQSLLDANTVMSARQAGRDSKAERYVSVHDEAERLLATMPEAGRSAYQREFGPRATALLEEARSNGGAEAYLKLVQRYLYTESGPIALQELARVYHKVGRNHLTALAYAKLLDHLGPARWTNDDLYQAMAAFHHCRSIELAERTANLLLARARQNNIRLHERSLTTAELRKDIRRMAPPRERLAWPMYRGDSERSNRATGGPPALTATWRQSFLYQEGQTVKPHLLKAEKRLQEQSEPIISAFSPLFITLDKQGKKKPLIVYKNYYGVMAIDARTGELEWASPSSYSLERMFIPGRRHTWDTTSEWLDHYLRQYPQLVFENSTVNTLSTDGRFVYAIEDLAVPPKEVARPRPVRPRKPALPWKELDFREIRTAPCFYPQMVWANSPIVWTYAPPAEQIGFSDYATEIQDSIHHSRLLALSLPRDGALAWEWGSEEKGALADCYFLGPPLPLDGPLYVIIETKQHLCLACIDTVSGDQRPGPRVLSMRPLIRVGTALAYDPIRRIQAVHLAYRDGILVCPTNNGVVLGYDLLGERLAWAYPYVRKSDPPARLDRLGRPLELKLGEILTFPRPPSPPNHHHWKVTAPTIAKDKVVFTPPDDSSIYCLNLTDGSLQWSHQKKSEDLYLGGVAEDTVLIVGMKSVYARSISTGEVLWTLETGLPSGQGILVGRVFYVPIQKGTRTNQPEICAIDWKNGQVIAHHQTKPRTPGGKDFEVPGNLFFVDDSLLTVTPWEIVSYRQK